MRFVLMEPKVTPSFFYGSAAAAAAGLVLGLALHGPWQAKAGAPQILFSQAQAAEVPASSDDGFLVQTSDTTSDDSAAYDGWLPATPLPVIRLQPDRYPDLFGRWNGGITQASTGEEERINPDDLYKAPDFGAEPTFDDHFAEDEAIANAQPAPTVHAGISDAELPAQPIPYSRY